MSYEHISVDKTVSPNPWFIRKKIDLFELFELLLDLKLVDIIFFLPQLKWKLNKDVLYKLKIKLVCLFFFSLFYCYCFYLFAFPIFIFFFKLFTLLDFCNCCLNYSNVQIIMCWLNGYWCQIIINVTTKYHQM